MVSHLTADAQTHFLTATSAPCTSIFKPVWLGVDLPDTGPQPTATYDAAALWWQHEALHRATLRNYAALLPLYASDRDALEHEFVEDALACRAAPPEERSAYAARCFARASEAEAAWLARVRAAGEPSRQGPLYAAAWRGFDRAAHMAEG
jgi:dipeptidase